MHLKIIATELFLFQNFTSIDGWIQGTDKYVMFHIFWCHFTFIVNRLWTSKDRSARNVGVRADSWPDYPLIAIYCFPECPQMSSFAANGKNPKRLNLRIR